MQSRAWGIFILHDLFRTRAFFKELFNCALIEYYFNILILYASGGSLAFPFVGRIDPTWSALKGYIWPKILAKTA